MDKTSERKLFDGENMEFYRRFFASDQSLSFPTTSPVVSAPTKAPAAFPTRPPTSRPTTTPTGIPTSIPTNAGLLTISQFVATNPDTTTLFAALERAGFTGILNMPGNFTLFGPTDQGFTNIPQEIVQLLFNQDQFIPHLRDLLLYHILPVGQLAASFPNATILQTFNTENVRILQEPFRVKGIPITTPDNVVSNGVVNTLNGVLAPTWVFNTIILRCAGDPDLSILTELLVLANLADALEVFGEEFTLLAPTNAAFEALGAEFLANIVVNRDTLRRILVYHVVISIFVTPEFSNGQRLLTAENGFVNVTLSPLQFNQANAVQVDILASNGVVQKIDAVLDPNQG
jgi:transforming growth factor-beta-induced protein